MKLTEEETKVIRMRRKQAERYEKTYEKLFAKVKEFLPDAKLETAPHEPRLVVAKSGAVSFYANMYDRPVTFTCFIKGAPNYRGVDVSPKRAYLAALKELDYFHKLYGRLLDELRSAK